MSGTLKITQPNLRENRYELVDKSNGQTFGDLAFKGFLGKICHASAAERGWIFEARRPKIFRKEVTVALPDSNVPIVSFKVDQINNCTVRLEDAAVFRLVGVRFSPDRAWKDGAGEKIITYAMSYYRQLVGFVLLPQEPDVNPDCTLLTMLGLYLIEQHQRGLRLTPQPLGGG